MEQSRELSIAFPYTLGAFGSPSTKVANFTYLSNNIHPIKKAWNMLMYLLKKIQLWISQSAGASEYADCTSAVG